jgi:hypothetical protein
VCHIEQRHCAEWSTLGACQHATATALDSTRTANAA